MLQIMLLALGVILLCTAHLGIGFFVGYRLRPQPNGSAVGIRQALPDYFPTVLDLIERSQQLQLQTSVFAQELPEKLVQAVARLVQSAECLHGHLRTDASLVLPTSEHNAHRQHSVALDRKPLWKPVGKPPSSVGIADALDCPTQSKTIHSQFYPQHAHEAEDQLDDSRLAMTDMMNLVAKANREACKETESDVRYPYPTQQFVAFSSEGETPPPEAFEPVQCLDVSAAGISFLLRAKRKITSLGWAA